MIDPKDNTYEGWLGRVNHTIDINKSWDRIGKWAYPNKVNSYREIFLHLCEASWRKSIDDGDNSANAMNGSTCHSCGTLVPEGIKMISLLGVL